MIDAVYVLNRIDRPERLSAFLAGYQKTALSKEQPAQVWYATPTHTLPIPDYWQHFPSYWACAFDHEEILIDAYQQHHRGIVIFEDDADFLDLPEFDKQVASLAALPPGALGYWFGGWHKAPPRALRCPDFQLLTGTLQTHAYFLTRAGIRRAFSHLRHEFRTVIDHAYAYLHSIEPHFYMGSHFTVKQRPGLSDHENIVRTHHH